MNFAYLPILKVFKSIVLKSPCSLQNIGSVITELLRFNLIKRFLKNVIKQAFGELTNIFLDEIYKNLSQRSTNVIFFL